MTRGQGRAARRKAARSPFQKAALVLAPLTTFALVGVGVATADVALPTPGDLLPSSASATILNAAGRSVAVSRSAERFEPVQYDVNSRVKANKWTSGDLSLRPEPTTSAAAADQVPYGSKVGVTGNRQAEFSEIVWKGDIYWVMTSYLVDKAPPNFNNLGDCTNGSSLKGGEAPAIARIHRAVCAEWPSVTRYGTWRGGGRGDHPRGKAVDIMVEGATGWEIANFLRQNYRAFDIHYLIYEQKIWQARTQSWQGMSNRGSRTANHFDHVHVSVN